METETHKWHDSEGGGWRVEGGEHSSHAWSSGLFEWCLWLGLLDAFSHASDNPFTNFVPFIRVCGRRVLECGLVTEKIVLSEPHVAAGGGANYGQSGFFLTRPKQKAKKEQITHWHPLHAELTNWCLLSTSEFHKPSRGRSAWSEQIRWSIGGT